MTQPEGVTGERRAADTSLLPFEHYRRYFQENHQMFYNRLGTYEQFEPAYRFGFDLARSEQYHDGDWERAEQYARNAWAKRHPAAWEQIKGAVHYGWERARSRL